MVTTEVATDREGWGVRDERVYSIREAARVLGTDRHTVAGLVRAWRLRPGPHPNNGRAVGLTAADLDRLRWALCPLGRRPAGVGIGGQS